MHTAPRIGIQGLRTQLRALGMLLAAVFSFFIAAVIDPLLAGGLGGIVVAVMTSLFFRRISHPLHEIAEAARQIAQGEHCARLPVPAKGGEIEVLTTAINALLASRERQSLELSTRETQFLSTFENAAVGIAHVGLDCHWLRVNTRLCEITGYPREELLSKTFIDITHPDDRETDMANVRAMIAGEIPTYSMEKRYIRKDGSPVWCNLTVTLARDASGHPGYFISVIEDISARKQAEEHLRKNEELLRMANEVGRVHAFEWDPITDEVLHTRGFEEALGLKGHPSSYTGQEYFAMVHPEDLGRFREVVSGLTPSSDTYTTTYRIVRPDGRIAIFEEHARGFFDIHGRMVRLIGMTADITARAAAEQALRESEENHRRILDNLFIFVGVLSPDGTLLAANRVSLEMAGLTIEETRGKKFWDTYWWAYSPEAKERLRNSIVRCAQGEALRYDTKLRVAGGRMLAVDFMLSPVRDGEGHVTHLVPSAVDITERKRAEETLSHRERTLSLALEGAAMGTWDWDPVTDKVLWSERTCDILGVPRGREADLQSYLEPVPPEDRERIQSAVRASLENGQDYDVEHRIMRPDGTVRWISSKGRAFFDLAGHPVRMLGVLTDITDRKRAEEELSAAKEAAEAANRTKDEFLASLSHELRTPLNPVLMLASEMEHRDALSPALRDDFALIRKNVALEARLIDDLLDLTRITRGKLQVERRRVDAHEVLNQALAVVQAEIVNKQISLTVEPSATNSWVNADPVRLQQIFWNVLSNAVKFTPSGGRITVRSRNTPEQCLCVEFRDTGIGMTHEELARMFTAFRQGDHATQPGSQYRFGGLGLGLTICRQLVTMHGGQIHARSDGRGLGSIFTIELPLAPAEAVSSEEVPARVSPQAAAGVPKHLHILLVEDHEPTRTTLSRLLRRRGHDVLCADSLAAGRKLLSDLATPQGKAGFDLLISDLGLPDGNGCELMTEVRKRYNGAVRGVALSGFGMDDDIQRSLASGFSTHLTKPVDIQSLENAMQVEQ